MLSANCSVLPSQLEWPFDNPSLEWGLEQAGLWKVSLPWQGWNGMSFKVPPTPTRAVIPWFHPCDPDHPRHWWGWSCCCAGAGLCIPSSPGREPLSSGWSKELPRPPAALSDRQTQPSRSKPGAGDSSGALELHTRGVSSVNCRMWSEKCLQL